MKELSFAVIGAAMEVHKILGLGFLESVYQLALEKELNLQSIPFQHQVELPFSYKGTLVGIYKKVLVEVLAEVLSNMPREIRTVG